MTILGTMVQPVSSVEGTTTPARRSASSRCTWTYPKNTIISTFRDRSRQRHPHPAYDAAQCSVFHQQDKKLDSGQNLREAGIPEGAVTLRLEVTGGGGGGGAAAGPPISLKVRVEGGKTFKVGTTMVRVWW